VAERLAKLTLLIVTAAVVVRFIVLPLMGNALVSESSPRSAEAAVVLSTGLEYYPRLMQAADLVRRGLTARVVINGNRKTEALRELERLGYQPAVPWYENSLRILELLGVDRSRVITVDAEDVYDTVSEAQLVGAYLEASGIDSLFLVTSRFHTRRAAFIWNNQFPGSFQLYPIAAAQDPFDPNRWWQNGRQIRWVLNEYGGWLFLLVRRFSGEATATASEQQP
jgi:uncharacterized SAM-binding protein YcdF (DUF218 family)